MTYIHLIIKEILYRKLNFSLSLMAVIIAVACFTGTIVLVKGYKIHTEKIFHDKYEKTEAMLQKAEDQYRKSTKKLGFNVLILPRDQNLSDFYADDYASKYMPEEYVNKLADNPLVTVRHLLPTLKQKIHWPEQKRTVILIGTRGEIPIIHKNPKKPLLEPVEPGNIVIGHQLQRALNLKVGNKVQLLGKKFKISKIHPERGNKDDITLWISLKEAQQLLKKPGKINAILALECKCAWADIDKVRAELGKILPDTQIIGMARRKAKSRSEIRKTAAELTKISMQEETENRERHLKEIQNFTNIFIPLIIFACAVWVGFLALNNVRERKIEIGILRAVGVYSKGIMLIFLAKAFIIGICGAVIGYLIGIIFGTSANSFPINSIYAIGFMKLSDFIIIVIVTIVLVLVSSWIPAMLASTKDPSSILREE